MNNVASKKISSILKFVYSENNSLSVIFQDNDLLMGVVGEFNENLKELEKITNTNLYSRGNSILIKSTVEKNEITKNAIQFLVNQFINNGSIEKKDIISSVDKFMINEKVKNKNKSLEGKTLNVLVENKMKDGIKLFGRTEYMTSVIFDGNSENIGKVVEVEITNSNQNSLFGKLKENFKQKVA